MGGVGGNQSIGVNPVKYSIYAVHCIHMVDIHQQNCVTILFPILMIYYGRRLVACHI